MHLDPVLPIALAAAFVVLVMAFAMRRYNQPTIIAYLLAGVLMGPHGLGLVTDIDDLTRLGGLGVVLLLFFVGMEVSIPRLIANWRVAIIGTSLQILLTTGAVWGLGWTLNWPVGRSVLIGFVLSLSSTAVVISILRQRGQLDTQLGNDALAVLLVQDVAIVPMILVIGLMADTPTAPGGLALQLVGSVLTVGVVVWVVKKRNIRLPFAERLRDDHELQVFGAFILCFGFATLTAVFQLSTALGAFVAGIVVAAAKETEWVHRSLDAFRVLLVALFFVSVGMLVSPEFWLQHLLLLCGLVAAVLIGNTILNAAILKSLGRPWGPSLRVGALLAQIGEFSFVLAALGKQQGLVSDFGYELSVGLIALSLILSPGWSALVARATGKFPDQIESDEGG